MTGGTLNALEKILARAAGKEEVEPGEIVDAIIDRIMITERQAPRVVDNLGELGNPRIRMPKEKVIVVFDHEVPPSKVETANAQRRVRERFSKQATLYDMNVGICHQVLPEKGHVEPGLVVVGTDSHTVTNGAFGAFATGIGVTDATGVLLTGTIWLKVPSVIAVQMEGRLPQRVAPKDAMLQLVSRLRSDGAQYKGLEFRGPGVTAMSLAGRMVMANMSVEVGAKAGFFAADEVVLSYLRPRVKNPMNPMVSDPDAEYEAVVEMDLSQIVPQVSCPHAVDSVVPITEVAGREIHDAFLGSCTNGRLEDLQAAAEILRGRRIHSRVRMVVAPASTETYLAALRSGVLETLVEAGAVVVNPNCASCASLHMDLLGDGEVSVSSTNRNFRGRRGSRDAEIYLASPATVAASALAGCIADPREF
jgi:homoaconitate hydratase family protein